MIAEDHYPLSPPPFNAEGGVPSLISLRRLSSACLLLQPISLSSLFFQLVYTLMPLIEFQTKDQLDQLTLFCIRRGGRGGREKQAGSLQALA